MASAKAAGRATVLLEHCMNALKMIGAALVVAGVLALAYGGFSYTKDTTAVKIGPMELSVKEKQTVNVPIWAGAGAVLAGGLLLVMGAKRG
jgi:multidrug transporter EmrE-like cation transporter